MLVMIAILAILMFPTFKLWLGSLGLVASLGSRLTGPKPKNINVETFRIDYLIRTPQVEKLSLQPISRALRGALRS